MSGTVVRIPVTLAALLVATALPALCSAQERSPWLPPPSLEPPGWQRPAAPPPPPSTPLPPLLTRPLSLPAGMLTLQWGAGFAYSELGTGGDDGGLGASFDLSAGLGKHLQLDFGTGLRFGTLLAADRYGRVFRDDVFQTGNRFVGNPWLKLRYSFLDGPERAFSAGVEALIQAPIAEASAFSVGVGVPVQFVLPAARLRVEAGLYMQFVLSAGATTRNVLNVPVRVLFGVSEGFAVGLVTGMQMGNAFRADASDANVQLGLVVRGRVSRSVELSGQWMIPAASPHGLDAYGLGFAVTHRAR
ncbi:MAG: hypothetical protein Q8S73_17815 [Deltaproteobacteria bacterium]|nr:hypothetical protein [Myxococcales bacterium]MDP3215969.1 hypothetical protein [Deltaproteobacteria bacterium]